MVFECSLISEFGSTFFTSMGSMLAVFHAEGNETASQVATNQSKSQTAQPGPGGVLSLAVSKTIVVALVALHLHRVSMVYLPNMVMLVVRVGTTMVIARRIGRRDLLVLSGVTLVLGRSLVVHWLLLGVISRGIVDLLVLRRIALINRVASGGLVLL